MDLATQPRVDCTVSWLGPPACCPASLGTWLLQVLMSLEPWSLPPADGLYNPVNEREACGVGFIVSIDGQRSHKVRTPFILRHQPKISLLLHMLPNVARLFKKFLHVAVPL